MEIYVDKYKISIYLHRIHRFLSPTNAVIRLGQELWTIVWCSSSRLLPKGKIELNVLERTTFCRLRNWTEWQSCTASSVDVY